MSIKSKHTTIYVVTGPTVATKILRLRGAGVPDGSASEIDVSDFDDDYDQFVAGRKATGTTTFEIIYDARDQAALETLYQSGAVTSFRILPPASETTAAAAPTVTASEFAPATIPNTIDFKGFVQNFSIGIADNDVWRGTITIKGSGGRKVFAGP